MPFGKASLSLVKPWGAFLALNEKKPFARTPVCHVGRLVQVLRGALASGKSMNTCWDTSSDRGLAPRHRRYTGWHTCHRLPDVSVVLIMSEEKCQWFIKKERLGLQPGLSSLALLVQLAFFVRAPGSWQIWQTGSSLANGAVLMVKIVWSAVPNMWLAKS